MRMLPLMLLSLLAITACRGGPTLDQPRSLAAPAHSAKEILVLLFDPVEMGQDLGRIRDGVKSAFSDQLDFGKADERIVWIYESAQGRLRQLENTSQTMANNELRRIKDLPDNPIWHQMTPQHMGVQLQKCYRSVPKVLGLNRRPLREPDDLEHRTDPDQNQPEASFLARVLRRVLP